MVSILILLDYLFLLIWSWSSLQRSLRSLNPYFIGLPILIFINSLSSLEFTIGLNPYFIGLPILIIQIHINKENTMNSLNPYFIGLPILI